MKNHRFVCGALWAILDDLGTLERIDKLTNLLRVNGDGYLARNVSRLLRSISIPILRKTTNSDDGLDA